MLLHGEIIDKEMLQSSLKNTQNDKDACTINECTGLIYEEGNPLFLFSN